MSQMSNFYAPMPQIYAPQNSGLTHGFLKSVHVQREVYAGHHLEVPMHGLYGHEELMRTHSCPSVQSVEEPKCNKDLAKEDEKKRKNREAAAACRQRRLDLIGKLEQHVDELEHENSELKRAMELLIEKNEVLVELLKSSHISVPKKLMANDKKISEITKSLASKTRQKVVNQPLKRGRKRKADVSHSETDEIKEEPITPRLFDNEPKKAREEPEAFAIPEIVETPRMSPIPVVEPTFNAPTISTKQPSLTPLTILPKTTAMLITPNTEMPEDVTERPRDLLINHDGQACTLALFSFNTPAVQTFNLLCQSTGMTPIANLPKIIYPTDKDQPSKDNELCPL